MVISSLNVPGKKKKKDIVSLLETILMYCAWRRFIEGEVR